MARLDFPFIGFAPDLDPFTPGAMPNVSNLVPTTNGFSPQPSLTSAGLDALVAACKGASVVRLLDDTTRFFAGTAAKLFEISGTSWSDVTRASGGDYSLGADTLWRFAQFGNTSFAAALTDALQYSTSSGAFANVGNNSPKAAIIETSNGFLMAFNYDDGSNHYADGWYSSPFQSPLSDWTASVATQAANGRLTETPGPIRGAKRLGNVLIAYKERSMYLGTYEGPPVIWRWQLIPGEAGAVSQEAIVEVMLNGSPVHIFAGFDDFYMYDGTRPVPIGKNLRKWYQTNVPAAYRYRIQAVHDPFQKNVYFYVPYDDGVLRFALVYNYISGKWGISATTTVNAAVSYNTQGMTYDALGTTYSTYADLPTDISYDSPFWTSNAPVPAIFNGTTLYLLSGNSGGTSLFYTHVAGDNDRFQLLSRIRPIYLKEPTTGLLQVLFTKHIDQLANGGISTTSPDDGSSQVISASNLSGGKHDVLKSSKFFQMIHTNTGPFEITGESWFFEEDGEE